MRLNSEKQSYQRYELLRVITNVFYVFENFFVLISALGISSLKLVLRPSFLHTSYYLSHWPKRGVDRRSEDAVSYVGNRVCLTKQLIALT